MIPETELRTLFDTHLKNNLAALETIRKNILKRYALGLLLVVSLAAANYLLVAQNPPDYVIVISVFISATGGFYYLYRTSQYKYKYILNFKSTVVAEIVKQIDPSWQYVYDSFIDERSYQQSGLFPHHYDRYRGEDFVSGRIDKTDFEFSELHTKYKRVTYGAKGRRQPLFFPIRQNGFSVHLGKVCRS